MLKINYFNLGEISLEQMIGFEMAGLMWGQYLTDDVTLNIGVQTSTTLEEYVIGGAIPITYEQNYGIYQEYLQNDITSADDDLAYYYLQDGNTVDFMVDGQIIDGNSQILLTSAQAKALGMDEALDLDLDEIQDLLGTQQLANKLALQLASEHQQTLNNGLSWTIEQQQALDTAQQLAADLQTALNPVWMQLLTDTAYQQLDQYLQGNLVLDATLIQYQDITTAQNIAAQLDLDLQLARDKALQLTQQLTHSYKAQYLNQQLSQAVDKLAVIFEQDKGTWTRDLVDPNAVDGYILLNDDFVWDYNYLRDTEAPESTLDFLSVALHETGHILGFTSGIDYSLEQETLYSGEEQLSNFTPLDLFRFSAASADTYNPDGSVADLSGNWFSIDGGQSILATLAQGLDANGDGYQASHWEGRYDPQGVMDPTLWYQERATISGLDVQAMDLLGWDLSDAALGGDLSLDLDQLLLEAKINLAIQLGMTVAEIEANLNGVPLSDPDAVAAADAAIANGTTDTSGGTDSTSSTSSTDTINTTTNNIATIDEFKQWWLENNQHGDDKIGNQGEFQKLWKAAYNFWYGSGDSAQVWWQDLYNWWFGDGGGDGNDYWWWFGDGGGDGNDYWWWFGDGGGDGNDYWWWFGDGGGDGNDYWQNLDDKSWWEMVFFAKANPDAVIDLLLPGQKDINNSTNSISTRVGGAEDDIFGGFVADDDISAGDGDDLIDGADGDDTLKGDAGNDTIFGFNDNDQIYGGTGNDMLSGENGNDAIYGEAGADVVWGGAGDDFLSGGEGRDFLVAGVGDDAVFGGADDDLIEGEAGSDLLVGEDGKDMIGGGSANDLIFGDSYSINSVSSVQIYLNDLKNQFGIDSNGNTNNSSSNNSNNSNNSNTTDVNTVVLEPDPPPPPESITIEIEAMDLSGSYQIEANNFASGGNVVKTDDNVTGVTTTTVFSGVTGYYDIYLGYYDTNNGIATINIDLGNQQLTSLQLDEQLGSAIAEEQTFVNRKIASSVQVNTADLLQIQGIGESDDQAYIDYIKFVPVAAPVTETPSSPSNPTISTIRFQAEVMTLGGDYQTETAVFASGGGLISTTAVDPLNPPATPFSGTVTTIFTGATGFYNVVVGYYDENDGNSEITAKVGGVEVDKWLLNQDLNMDLVATDTFVSRTIAEGIVVNQGDQIFLQGIADAHEGAAIDYIEFVPVEDPALQLSDNSDILRGGGGDDIIFGDLGNDVIYGEDEFNNGSVQDINLTGGYTYGQSTYILSSAGTWEAAQAQARSLGGNLVTINDIAEESWLKQTFGTNELWIGLTDKDSEGNFQWISGEKITYTNWAPTEPNNTSDFGSDADFVRMNYNDGSGGLDWGDFANNGVVQGIIEIDWSVAGGNDTLVGGKGDDIIYGNSGNDVIEGDGYSNIDLSNLPANLPNGKVYNGSLYLLTDLAPNWQTAQTQAEGFGGNLVTLNDAAENQWIKDNFGSSENFWIGFTDEVTEGQWEWISGQQVTHINWSPDNPNPFLGEGQDHAVINSSGQWDATFGSIGGDDDLVSNLIYRGIVEIELPSNINNADIYNGSLYLLTDSALNWQQAQAQAESYGGNLVTINDGTENQWLKDTFGTTEALWTGFSDAETEGTWKWASGEVANWVLGETNDGIYADWAPGNPDDYNGNQDYATLSHIWDDVNSDSLYRGIIEVKLSDTGSLTSGSNDIITGGSGSDIIRGGGGNDIINGSNGVAAGYYERDIVMGGTGADRFILGDEIQIYYATRGHQDYVVIKDFYATEDVVQLHGVASDYYSNQQGSDVFLYRSGDLVAIFEGVNSIDLYGTGFEYV